MKRIIALISVLALALSLCGCGGGKDEEQAADNGVTIKTVSAAPQPAPEEPETTTAAEEPPAPAGTQAPAADGSITLPEGYTVRQAKVLGDTVYIAANNGLTEDPYSANCVCAASLAGGTAEPIYTDGGFFENYAPASDGSVWVLDSAYDEQSQALSYTLVHAVDGGAAATVPVTDLGDLTGSYFVRSMFAAEDGGAVLVIGLESSCLAAVVDTGGTVVSSSPVSGGWFDSLARLGTGELAGLFKPFDGITQGEPYLATLDASTGAVTALPVSGDVQADDYTSVLTGDGSTVFLQFMSTVRPYDRASGTVGEGDTWINMGVNDYDLLDVFLRDGALWTLTRTGSGLRAAALRTGEDDRQVLTLATMRTDWLLTPAVAAFNQTSPDYRIEIHDYTAENPWIDQALEQLNYDIIGGDIPDMYYLVDMPYDTLVKQGLLADLSNYVNSMDMSQYLENIVCAARQEDGALYSVIPTFSISSWVAPADAGITAADMTLENLMARQQADPSTAVVKVNSDDLPYGLTSFFGADIEHYVNFNDASCTFDSQEFIDLLNMVKTMPQTTYDEMTGQEIYGTPRIEEAPEAPDASQRNYIMSTYGLSDYFYFGYADEELGFEPVFVGCPGEEGGVIEVLPNIELGLSSQTDAPDACWEFLSWFLSDDFQGRANDPDFSFEAFPVKLDVLDGMAARYVSEDWITQEDADYVNSILASEDLVVSRRFSLAEEILSIVREEVQPFFEDQTTAEAAAASIQSRVGLYLSEHA